MFFFFSQKAEFIVCKEPSFILRLSLFFELLKYLFAFSLMK